jgi:hypothetical protein
MGDRDGRMTVAGCLLPERRSLCGPLTRRRIARLFLVYLAFFLLGLAVAQAARDPQWQAFGLGLMIPGGGFLAHAGLQTWHGAAHVAVAAAAFALFVGALFLWFATGNVIAPPLVWLLAAFAAASMDHGALEPHAVQAAACTVGAAALVLLVLAVGKRSVAGFRRRAANDYLKTGAAVVAASARSEGVDADRREFTLPELRLMRFLLDRALQPVTSYDGFEWLDQFQTAAVRYQLNFIGYALSMAQATRLPALGSYLNEAQRRLIDKQTDHRIWRYWAIENLWGNLRADPNPVVRENIMFTGFCATQIAMYHAASGRRDYDRPASFALRPKSGKSYDYDFGSLIEALHRQLQRSVFTLIACEPNWIYPLCNTIGAAAIKVHDRSRGTDWWSLHEPTFRQHLEHEFIDLAGRFVPCRSTYSGFALPMIGGAQPQAMPSFFLNATMPDIALRQWLLLRRQLVETRTPDDALARRRFWRVDTGNYRFSRAAAFAGTALAAVEMGDQEVADLCLAALEQECPARVEADAWYRPNASVWAHAVEFFARSGAKNGFRDLIDKPRDRAPAPMMSDVPYPDILVARAGHAHRMLTAVLYPGGQHGRFRFRVCGLAPDASYVCDGTEQPRIRSDRAGEAMIKVALIGRTEIRIRPAT